MWMRTAESPRCRTGQISFAGDLRATRGLRARSLRATRDSCAARLGSLSLCLAAPLAARASAIRHQAQVVLRQVVQ